MTSDQVTCRVCDREFTLDDDEPLSVGEGEVVACPLCGAKGKIDIDYSSGRGSDDTIFDYQLLPEDEKPSDAQ